MSGNLPANFDPERAGVVESEERCDLCGEAPCECERKEQEMDQRRLERSE